MTNSQVAQMPMVSWCAHATRLRQAFASVVLCLSCFALPGAATLAKSDRDSTLLSRVQVLLDAYARDDSSGVLQILDSNEFAMYGSDASELVSTPAQLVTVMADDFKLWHTAKFGRMRDITTSVRGDCGSVFFQIPFSAGGSAEVLVRFATVWRRANGVWLLTVSSNTVPTVGSSAADILKANSPR
jgi:Domain of unknown function (DUF4440)